MRNLFTLVLLGGFLFAGSMQLTKAEDAEPNAKEWTEYHKLDKELTDLYQKTLISLENAKARENLTNSENSFLDYRKTQGTFVAMGVSGGTPDKALMVASFTSTTEARIAELKKWQAAQKK